MTFSRKEQVFLAKTSKMIDEIQNIETIKLDEFIKIKHKKLI